MRSKPKEPTNKSRPLIKCDICGKKFLNKSAFASHHKFLHTNVAKTDQKRVALKKQPETRPVRKKAVPVHMLNKVNPSPVAKEAPKLKIEEKTPDLPEISSPVTKKPEFECPVCAQKFPVYFTTFRHIQKNHCVDENGVKVPPNSPLLVKPIRIEICGSCCSEIRSTEPHSCPYQLSNRDPFICLACNQMFNGLLLFQQHVKGLHADGAQNFFFPSRTEFTTWKEYLEKRANVDFIILNKHKSKEIYHCSHQSPALSSNTKLCPSAITVREYTKGLHVCYYPDHHGHTLEFIPWNKFNQYCISLYTRETEELTLKSETEDENDLYLQFKRMVTCIVLDAAKVQVNTLKELLGKALEMTTILKHSDKEDEPHLINKCLTDVQLSKILNSLKSTHSDTGKRKLSPAREAKKIEPKRLRKDPLIERVEENGMTTRQSRSSPALQKSVSFTKSILKKTIETPQKPPNRKTEVTPKSLLKNNGETPVNNNGESDRSLLKKNEQEQSGSEKNVEKPLTPVPRSMLQSPSSFNESYKNFVDQNFKTNTETSTPKTKTTVKKKEIVKTKIGQFKVKTPPSPKIISPKSPKLVKSNEVKDVGTPKAWKTKPDIKYEVKEQENDCNILILKI